MRGESLLLATAGGTLWRLFGEPLTQQAIQKSLIAGSLVAVVCGVIGCFIILRRLAFLGDAISHAMLAGVTAGYLFMKMAFGLEAHPLGMLLGSLLAGLCTVLLVGFVARVSRIKNDTAIGIIYTGVFALGGVLASLYSHEIKIDLLHFVSGHVLGVEDEDLWFMAFIASFVLVSVILLFRQLQITSFDPVMAASLGVPVVLVDYLLTTCTSLVVVGAVAIVGVILVVGLLVTPAATAYLLCNRLHRMMVLAALFGVTSVVGGVYISTWVGNVATGSAIVLTSTVQFLVVLVVAPRYGLLADWLRRLRLVPQQILEDVLRAVEIDGAQHTSLETITRHTHFSFEKVRHAVRELERREWLVSSTTGVRLTEAGQREARRLVRAHRLWETYLQHVGMPSAELHARAHQLEHVHDEEAVDYLDDMLGHPLLDPHGAEIPADLVHLVAGQETKASLLRENHQATVTAVGPAAALAGLAPGDRVVAGPRRNDQRLWTLKLASGREIELDHAAADAISVRFEG